MFRSYSLVESQIFTMKSMKDMKKDKKHSNYNFMFFMLFMVQFNIKSIYSAGTHTETEPPAVLNSPQPSALMVTVPG